MNLKIPKTQYAIELYGEGKLKVNKSKPVIEPTGFQVLCKVEATGLCFSDLKLLKQFSAHARKGQVVSGIDKGILETIPSYVPDDMPTVPGHETVVRIVAVGDKVREHKVGERCLVQTDYRGLKTAGGSNAAFGYNFEGGLQEYVIVDERISRDAETGERLLIPVGEGSSASSICLVEPWACVEDSYQSDERKSFKKNSRVLVVIDPDYEPIGIKDCFHPYDAPFDVTVICSKKQHISALRKIFIEIKCADNPDSLPDKNYDDIIYFGVNKDTIIFLDKKLADGGIINIVKGRKKIGSPVPIVIGRIHYGRTRWVGTTSKEAHEGYDMIPFCLDLCGEERILIIGAGGPMGQMHTIRNICSEMGRLKITATDLDDTRLESLRSKAEPLAKKYYARFKTLNTSKEPITGTYDYIAIMVPAPQLVSNAIKLAANDSKINIFAGIPASTIHEIDLDMLIQKRCFLFGTSGSVLKDMKIVLDKIKEGWLDTDISVDAISGMAGAIDGISALENRTMSGKIIVYPQIHELGLLPLSELSSKLPNVAAMLKNGIWCKEAENELLKSAT